MTHTYILRYSILAALMISSSGCEVKSPEPHGKPVTQMNESYPDAINRVTNNPAASVSIGPVPATSPERMIIGAAGHPYPLLKTVREASRLDGISLKTERDASGNVLLRIPLNDDESIWGFGQRLDAFNMRGRTCEAWTVDGWNDLNSSYYAVPFFISSRGYGLFINNTGRIRFDIGSTKSDEILISIPDAGADVIAFSGTPSEISRSYTELVGRPRSVPDWIFRLWLSRNSFLGAYEIDRVTSKMSDLGMPVGVVVLEAWEEQLHNFKFSQHRYPDTEAWIARLKQQGVHVVCWLTSSMWVGTEVYNQAKERGYLVLNEDGSEHVVRWLENGRKIDFRKSGAFEWWRDLHKPLVAMGVDGFKTDGGEHMPDAFFHNLHTYYYQKGSLDSFKDSGRDGITFARSACPLNAGLGAFWAGDQNADWSRLKAVVKGGLSTSLAGFFFWGHDIGGYTGTPAKDLYIRWLQFGAFSPIMQMHGVTAREPWHYDQETLEIAKFYFMVREALVPYLQQWAATAINEGTPILRPLVWDFPSDEYVRDIDSQYLFGPDLLVAPIVDPLQDRGVYLPAGDWVDVWSGAHHAGPKNILVHASLDQIPVFARASAAVQYMEMFAGETTTDNAPIRIELAGERNDRGIVSPLHYWKADSKTVQIYYEIRNEGASSASLTVRLPVPAGFTVEPSDSFTFTLGIGEVQRVAYTVAMNTSVSVGTYPFRLLLEADGTVLRAPATAIVVSPRWSVLGLLDGGVGSSQPQVDVARVDLQKTYSGRNGRTVGWQPVTDTAIDADGLIDFGKMIGSDGGSTTFAYTRFELSKAKRARLLLGSGDSMTVWVNGSLVKQIEGHRNAERDEDVVPVNFTAGRNDILVRISRDLGQNHLYFRIVD